MTQESAEARIARAITEIMALVPEDADRADDTDNQAGFRNAIEQVLQILAASNSACQGHATVRLPIDTTQITP